MNREAASRKVRDTLAEMFTDPVAELGDEWFTVSDVETECKINYRIAYDMCKKKVAAEEIEMRRIGRNVYFRFIRDDDGAIGGGG